jgi:cell division GTPase FtsZ
MTQRVFILPESCRSEGMERLKSYFLPMILMRDKNLLHIINKIKIWEAFGRPFKYIHV